MRPLLAGGLGVLLLSAFASVFAAWDTTSLAYVQRQALAVRLDSIEVEKQAALRQGLDLSELEALSLRLRDSLTLLRTQLAGSAAAEPPTAAKRVAPFPRLAPDLHTILALFQPRSGFDWVIASVGAVAAVSGGILLIGLIVRFFRRRADPLSRHRLVRPKSAAASAELYRETQLLPRISPSMLPPITPAARESADIDNTGLDVLRQRMVQGERPGRATEPPSPLGGAEVATARPVAKTPTGKQDQRTAIIGAARQGLTIQEIARQYKVSVDQVKLILRVASDT